MVAFSFNTSKIKAHTKIDNYEPYINRVYFYINPTEQLFIDLKYYMTEQEAITALELYLSSILTKEFWIEYTDKPWTEAVNKRYCIYGDILPSNIITTLDGYDDNSLEISTF